MEKWLIQGKKADFDGIGEKFGISPYLVRVIRNRDIVEEAEYKEYLECSLDNLHSPMLLKDMEKAVSIINEVINSGDKIRVIGDYDIDGVCAGYIITDALRKFGGNVDFDVPERIADGYGINNRLIDKAHNDGISLIITCDNGIAASAQIEYAKELGMKIIVTDHHEVPFIMQGETKRSVLPKADAVVDHKREDCEYPFKELCGAAVGYKLIEAYYDKYILFKEKTEEILAEDKRRKEKFLKKYLVFATIATVGDVVPLLRENRIIVKNGLKYIKSVDNYGLRALIEVNELKEREVSSYHISFVIGPCINSGGRIDTAKRVFELFECEDEERAFVMAKELKEINEERKAMTIEGTNRAIELFKEDESMRSDRVIVVYLENCHESLAGIIAGRLKDIFYKPIFVFTEGEIGLKGSGRSIEGYSMFEELTMANELYKKENKEPLFTRFGGHKMAAGVSIEKNKFDIMRKLLNSSNSISDDIFIRKIWIDVPLPFEYMSEELINQLALLEPFGMANEKPVFADKCIGINNLRILGKNRNVISMRLINNSGYKIDAVYFSEEADFIETMESKFDKRVVEDMLKGREVSVALGIIYYPEINEYMGYRNIRVVIKRIS